MQRAARRGRPFGRGASRGPGGSCPPCRVPPDPRQGCYPRWTDVPHPGRQPTRAARDGGRSELRWRATPPAASDRTPGRAARLPDRTNGCTSRSSARHAADVAAPATERSTRKTSLQPPVLDPDRPLAPSEGSNDGSRDRRRAAASAGPERPPPDLPTADLPIGGAGHQGSGAHARGAARANPGWEGAQEQGARSGEGAREAEDVGPGGAGPGQGRGGPRRRRRIRGPSVDPPAQPRRSRSRRSRPRRRIRVGSGRDGR